MSIKNSETKKPQSLAMELTGAIMRANNVKGAKVVTRGEALKAAWIIITKRKFTFVKKNGEIRDVDTQHVQLDSRCPSCLLFTEQNTEGIRRAQIVSIR